MRTKRVGTVIQRGNRYNGVFEVPLRRRLWSSQFSQTLSARTFLPISYEERAVMVSWPSL